MKTALLFLCLVISHFGLAQSKLAGFVTEQNSGKKPVENVLVKSSGANSIEPSSTEGKFILTFQDLPAGKNVIVRAEKEGWEIVNEKEMSTFIPFNPDEKPLKIIICPVGALAKAKSKYYDTFEQNLLKELNRQKALNKGNEKEIARLEEDYAKVQKQLNDLADEYSRINLDDASEKELKAIELFKAGKFNEFIELKRSIVTEAQVDKALKNKEEANKTIANSDSTIALYFKSQKDIAKTQIQLFKFKEAEDTYLSIYRKDTTNQINLLDFSEFLGSQLLKFDEAIYYSQKALIMAKNARESAESEVNLGVFNSAKGDDISAIHFYESALIKHSAFPEEIQIQHIARVNLNLGNSYLKLKKDNEALKFHFEALKIMENLANQNKSKYNIKLADYLCSLAFVYVSINDTTNALNNFNKALAIYSNSPDSAKTIHESGGQLYNNLGILYLQNQNYDYALKFFFLALKIREFQKSTNIVLYESLFLSTYENIASVYTMKKNYSSALKIYCEILKSYEVLAMTKSEFYKSYLARINFNIGLLYKEQNDYSLALKYSSKSLEIYEDLLKNNLYSFELDFVQSIILLGQIHKYDQVGFDHKPLILNLYKAKRILSRYRYESFLNEVVKLEFYYYSFQIFDEIKILSDRLKIELPIFEKINLSRAIITKAEFLILNGYSNIAELSAYHLTKLSKYQLLNMQFADAEKSAKEALNPITFKKTEDYDAKIEWANTNLALALLFQGKYAEAVKIYVALKDKPYNKTTYREAFLADLEELEKSGITHPDVVKIKELLKK